jgi:hypothetical protein
MYGCTIFCILAYPYFKGVLPFITKYNWTPLPLGFSKIQKVVLAFIFWILYITVDKYLTLSIGDHMMIPGIVASVIGVAIIVLLVVFRKTVFVKLTWKYSLILLPVIFLIAVALFSRKKTGTGGANTAPPQPDINTVLSKVKDRLNEANMQAAIEVTAARTQDQAKLDQLKKVTDIKDDTERRKQLAALLG